VTLTGCVPAGSLSCNASEGRIKPNRSPEEQPKGGFAEKLVGLTENQQSYFQRGRQSARSTPWQEKIINMSRAVNSRFHPSSTEEDNSWSKRDSAQYPRTAFLHATLYAGS